MRLGLGHEDPVADPIAYPVTEPVTDGDPDPACVS